MPAIDYTGDFYTRGVCTGKGSRGAIGFPIKASTAGVARRFANKMILKLLPGWDHGTVVLTQNGKRVMAWILSRREQAELLESRKAK